MPQLNAARYVAEIEASTSGLAEILAEYDQSLPIPTCPEWTLRQLVTHVGRAHRWAAEITRTRSDAFIPFREVPDGKLPDDRAEQRAWLHAGAARLVDAVREAGSDLVWSFTGPTPAGFWIRRMAHETLVHRADAQLAAGAEPEPVIEAEIAADAIDEWLMLVTGGPGAGRMRPDRPAPITISARSSRIRKPRTGHHTDCGGDAPAAGPPGVRMGSRSSQVSDTGGRTAHQGRIAAARRDPGWPAGPGVLRPTVKDLRAW